MLNFFPLVIGDFYASQPSLHLRLGESEQFTSFMSRHRPDADKQLQISSRCYLTMTSPSHFCCLTNQPFSLPTTPQSVKITKYRNRGRDALDSDPPVGSERRTESAGPTRGGHLVLAPVFSYIYFQKILTTSSNS